MIRTVVIHRIVITAGVAVILFPASMGQAAKAGWRPLASNELAQKEPQVENDADAEALFWNVDVEDATSGNRFLTQIRQEVRVKVFTTHGVESRSWVKIPFENGTQVDEIEGRTVLPSGKIIELKKSDVFEQTLLQSRGRKIKAKTFLLPGVEPGAILDYRWHEVRYEQLSINARLPFQMEIPVQRLVYRIKPLPIAWEANVSMKTTMFNGISTPFDQEPDGFFRTAMANVRAFKSEPDMPAEWQVKPWMLLWYGESTSLSPDAFWSDFGRRQQQADHQYLKQSKQLKDAVGAITAGAAGPDQKLGRISDFCRTKIRNLSDDASGLTAEQRSKVEWAKSPADTYARKEGTSRDIDYLMAALSIAAGFDARLVRLGDRSDLLFDPNTINTDLLTDYCVAVKSGDHWSYFDPAVTYVPPGMLPWWLEGTKGVLPDDKQPVMVNTPSSPSALSRCRRTANIKLAANGDLSGVCRLEYTGHWDYEMKESYDDVTPQEREKALVAMVQLTIGTATVTDVKVENVTDTEKPFTWTIHLEAPAYAQATGSRLFVQPGVFQHAREPRFTASRRRFPIQFDYAWSEDDSVTIELPPGTALGEAAAPTAPFPTGNVAERRSSVSSTVARPRS